MAFIIFIFNRIKSLCLIFIGLWRRALCCFRRKRRPSCDALPLTTVHVVNNCSTNTRNTENESDMNSWRNWDEESKNKTPNTIQEHIEFYRQQAIAARTQQLQQDVEDQTHAEIEHYFEDMKPKFTGQTKILIKNGAADSVNTPSQFHTQETNRLSLNPEMISTINGGQLGEWQESAWENEAGDDSWEVNTILREKRRQEREQKQLNRQQKLVNKSIQPQGTARVNT